ncbi:MAG: cytochrome c biogenesis protein CcsA [Anaerolineae bacterium]|nr:cytochrome c biogenesis protein CcsA [Anaerolineae bacterium]
MAATTVPAVTVPEEARRHAAWPPALLGLTLVTALMLAIASYMSFIYAPTEVNMGAIQRIFYFHVGAAWAGGLAFLVTVVAGVVYLITGKQVWDRVGHSSVEVGLMLTTIALAGGMVWSQVAWGKPWTWDPKLTSFAVMWLSYAAYLMLRQGIEEPTRRARFAAVYGIVAFAGVIMTYMGVRAIEATIHPYVVGEAASTANSDFGLTERMTQTLMFSFLTFTAVFASLLWHRMRLEALSERVEALKMHLLSRGN